MEKEENGNEKRCWMTDEIQLQLNRSCDLTQFEDIFIITVFVCSDYICLSSLINFNIYLLCYRQSSGRF